MYFDIKYWYINYEIELDDLEESACKEMNGPGYFLHYRALIKKIREIGQFQITSGLFFKASLGAHPFICKSIFIHTQIKLIFMLQHYQCVIFFFKIITHAQFFIFIYHSESLKLNAV